MSNRLKFENCQHACEYLLQTTGNIVEAMNNLFWGSGFPPDVTKTTLQEYWPSENQFGKILLALRDETKEGSEVQSIEPT